MPANLIENRQIRIFISSTFQDMAAERDYLVKTVFPSLRAYCSERDVTLQELDLRWGITKEQSERGEVVDICLKEIRNTTPFFIGLLGERYGWIPTPEQQQEIAKNTPVFQVYPWVREELELNNTSITEIEIQEGVLRSAKKVNAYFYFRSPKMEVPDTLEYREKPDKNACASCGLRSACAPGNALPTECKKAQKLRKLKMRLRGERKYPVSEYDSPEHLGEEVERDFKELVDALYPKGSFSPLKKERLEQEIFLKRRLDVYAPLPDMDAKIDAFAKSGGRALVIAGESGSGKSSLLAHWIKEKKALETVKILYHFVGQSASEGDYQKIGARLIGELRDMYSLYEDAAKAIAVQQQSIDDKQKSELQTLFASVKGYLIIILDGVDKLSDDNAKRFNWLPEFPENIKFIFSAKEGDASLDYFRQMNYSIAAMPALPLEVREIIIEKFLGYFGKHLSAPQIKKIAEDPESGNPLALSTLLDEVRMYGEYGKTGEKLDAEIDRYLKPDSIVDMFVIVLERLENTFGRDVVQTALSMLYVSRNGLSEEEIHNQLLIAPLYWSRLYNGMSNYLTIRGGLITFAQEYIREAVKKRYFADKAAEIECRRKLIDCIKNDAKESRKRDEIPYQLLEIGDGDGLYQYLLNYDIFNYMLLYQKTKDEFALQRNRFEIIKYWAFLFEKDKNKYKLENYLQCDTKGKTEQELADLYYELTVVSGFLSAYSAAYHFGKASLEIKEKLFDKDSLEMAETYMVMGAACTNIKREKESLEYQLKSLAICQNVLGDESPHTARAYVMTGITYCNTDSQEKGLEYIRKGHTLQEKILGHDNPQTAFSRTLLEMMTSGNGDANAGVEAVLNTVKETEKMVGKDNMQTAVAYLSAAAACAEAGDTKTGLEYAEKSLALNKKLYGELSWNTGFSYRLIGIFYLTEIESLPKEEKQKVFEKFLENINKAIEIFSKISGDQRDNLKACFDCLVHVSFVMADDDEALEYGIKSYQLFEKQHGKDSPEALQAKNYLSKLYYYKGINAIGMDEKEEAIEFFTKAIELNPKCADYFQKRSAAYMALWDMDKSIADSDEALRLAKEEPEAQAAQSGPGILSFIRANKDYLAVKPE